MAGRFERSRSPSCRWPHPTTLGQIGFVEDLVGISLLGQEKLTVVREIHLARVTAHQSVETCGNFPFLGPENSAEALGFFLPAAEGP